MDYMTFLFIQPKTTMQHNDKQRERKIPCEISQLAINSASKKLLYKIFPALIELFLDEIFTIDLTVTTYCQIDGEDIVNFCGLLRKSKL